MGSALKNSRDFNLIDAIYIDWRYYISIFERAISSQEFILNTEFETKLDIVDSYIKVKALSNSDDIEEFINFYTSNKNLFEKVRALS